MLEKYGFPVEQDALKLFWTLDISQTASYEITLIRLSVRLSVRISAPPFLGSSLSFLRIKSLVFAGIIHDDSWPWYLVTDEPRFLKKKNNNLNQTQNEIFRYFLKLGSYVFLESAYNDSLEHCLTPNRRKNHKKNLEAQL